MKPGTKTFITLAAIGQHTTYAELHAATGYDTKLLTNIVAGLKRRGFIARVNPQCSNHVPAILRITSKGMGELTPLARLPDPGETMVGMAKRGQPFIATCWHPAQGALMSAAA